MQAPSPHSPIKSHRYKGIHLLLECWEVPTHVLNDIEYLRECMLEAAQLAEVHVIGEIFHPFSPQGITGVLLLAESHMSIHTWPENGYAAIDIYTCGDAESAEVAAASMVKALSAVQSAIIKIERGGKNPIIHQA